MNRFNNFLKGPRNINIFAGVLFIVLIATIAHLLFSNLGLNPTDDGWLLAGSRRIIDGQIPHRDVIFHMPTFSFYFHAPFVLLGGDYVFLASRYFVWIQFASIAWTWTVIITRSFKVLLKLIERFAVALIVFFYSVHNFPIMAWFTIDGIFFVSLGILLCHNESKWAKMIGYVFIGISPLCKQVFLPMIPMTILIFKDWRQIGHWIMASFPIVVYGIYLTIFDALHDAILQLTTYSDFYAMGIVLYLNNLSVMWGIIVGGLAAYMIYRPNFRHQINKSALLRFLGLLILFGIIFFAAWHLAKGRYTIYSYKRSSIVYLRYFEVSPSFGIFGAASGVILYFIAREQKLTNYIRSGLLAVCVAWCTSLSLGYNFPTLATGPLILVLIASVKFSCQWIRDDIVPTKSSGLTIRWILSPRNLKTLINVLIILSIASSLVAFGLVRQNHIYREQPASQLTYDLGDVLPGAKGIKTNKNTYNFFMDLQNAKNVAKEKGKKYCIIPDMGANWVKDSQSNPLSTDCTSFVDFSNNELLDRVIGELEEIRGTIIVIVQKYRAEKLPEGFQPIHDSHELVNYVRLNFDKIEETQYFELYE